MSASVGVSCHQQAESLSLFIAQADTQLYEAKKLGRNRVMPIIA
ncbi:diguanylate cyclase domain-containing protein [Shewanella sp. NFH-SH190041]|nr:diguanylate cyclase [Shewanella sp. NFH-SH190041]